MPKIKETQREFVYRVVQQYPGVFRSDGTCLFCLSCNKPAAGNKLFSVTQHLLTVKHKAASAKRSAAATTTSQTLLPEFQKKVHNTYPMDLCSAFLEANIPSKKVSHPSIKKFLERYTKGPVPSESVLRQKYVPILYKEAVDAMVSKAHNKYIWVSVDETTDVEQRLVINFIFGILDGEENSPERQKCYLFNVATVEAGNASNVAAFFNDTLSLLWPNGIQYENVMLVVTDAANYMLSAFRGLQVLYPKMIHLTCAVHGLHRIAEFVRSKFPEVNELISNVKAIYVKAPLRRNIFKTVVPNTPLPPNPITRWGTWLKAAVYYCDHFDDVRTAIEALCEDDAEAIRAAKNLFMSTKLKVDLAFIKCNFSSIILTIVKLETPGLDLKDGIHLIESVRGSLSLLSRKEFHEKFLSETEAMTLFWKFMKFYAKVLNQPSIT